MKTPRQKLCIIGSGIAGLTTAYRLLQDGKSVVVLESGTLGSGMTPLMTARLSEVMDRGMSTIQRLHGEQGARSAVQSHTALSNGLKRQPPKNPSHATSNGWTGICSPPPPRCHPRKRSQRAPHTRRHVFIAVLTPIMNFFRLLFPRIKGGQMGTASRHERYIEAAEDHKQLRGGKTYNCNARSVAVLRLHKTSRTFSYGRVA